MLCGFGYGYGMDMGMGMGVGVGVGCQLVNLVFLLQLFLALGSRVRFRFQVSRLLAKKPVRRSIISSAKDDRKTRRTLGLFPVAPCPCFFVRLLVVVLSLPASWINSIPPANHDSQCTLKPN